MFFDSLTMPEETVERQARTLAPILGATSDGRAHADNARSLMITVLGEFVRPNGGSVWTQTLIDAMGLLDVQPKATRQVVARLADRGWLDRTKEGRRTRWHLTALSQSLLESGAERIYGFGRSPIEWDGRWLVLLASLPERDQALRYQLTTGLNWAGFGSLGQGTWISPWTRHEAEAVAVVRDVGVDGATSFVAEVSQLGNGTELAARAWDLDAIRDHYDDFLRRAAINESAADVDPVANRLVGSGRTGASRSETTDQVDASALAVRDLTVLVHQWRRFPFLDPALPAALLPSDWPGARAVETFASRRGSLAARAVKWWSDAEARYGSVAA